MTMDIFKIKSFLHVNYNSHLVVSIRDQCLCPGYTRHVVRLIKINTDQ